MQNFEAFKAGNQSYLIQGPPEYLEALFEATYICLTDVMRTNAKQHSQMDKAKPLQYLLYEAIYTLHYKLRPDVLVARELGKDQFLTIITINMVYALCYLYTNYKAKFDASPKAEIIAETLGKLQMLL